MDRESGPLGTLARQFGLARAPLFRPGDAPPLGEHEILLDGSRGSFTVSVASDIDPLDASSWAWSSNAPHHVVISGRSVKVIRYDRPNVYDDFNLKRVKDDPLRFYVYLKSQDVNIRQNVVRHFISLFRSVRSLVNHSGMTDERSLPAYLAILQSLARSGGERASPKLDMFRRLELPADAKSILSELNSASVEALTNEFGSVCLGNQWVDASFNLAIRHASGAIFQEAHHTLIHGADPDMFGRVGPASARQPRRGGVHFTPPYLARALAERVFIALPDLHARKRIVIADIACGSGAFLLEALRALERLRFKGRVILVGRDSSSIAIDMARFVLSAAAAEWPRSGLVEIDLATQDTLAKVPALPPVDVVVMNPPFSRWQDLDLIQKARVVEIAGGETGGRPDLSIAFIARALDILAPNGAMATLLPATALESKALDRWRSEIFSRKYTHLRAIFDNQDIFSHAKVRVGALVLGAETSEPPLAIHAGSGPESAGDALRALRRGDTNRNEAGEDFSIWIDRGAGVIQSRSLRGRLTGSLDARGNRATDLQRPETTPTIGSLFDVRQGIRTGQNPAFVLTQRQLVDLPKSEQKYFRKAVSSRGIKGGRITTYYYIFYPYGEYEIENDFELKDSLPDYSSKYLDPVRVSLESRRGRSSKWWLLSERRPPFEDAPPVFASKYWAGTEGFVFLGDTDLLVLQGFGWAPKADLAKKLKESSFSKDIIFAYLSIFNSDSFVSIVADHAPPTGGGQLDMSPRYTSSVPLPDLTEKIGDGYHDIALLSLYSQREYIGVRGIDRISKYEAEDAIARLLNIKGRSNYARHSTKLDAIELPSSISSLMQAGLSGVDRVDRVKVLVDIQSLAKSGRFNEIDEALKIAPAPQLAETSLMTLLRGTFRFRSRLSEWVPFRNRVAAALAENGAPVERLLIGLYE